MDNTNYSRIISICTGFGGIERGLDAAGFNHRTICHVEIEAFAIYNMVKKMEQGKMDTAPIWTNLKTFDGKPFCNRIHGIVGGYPCQGESVAGKQRKDKDERFLWPYIERLIKDSNPLFVFFENVGGHLSGSFPIILKSLRKMGFEVEAGLFSAAEVGAPHIRQRFFALGYSNRDEFRKHLADSNSKPVRVSNKQQRKKKTNVEKDCSLKLVNPDDLQRSNIIIRKKQKISNLGSPSVNILSDSYEQRTLQGYEKDQSKFFNQDGIKWPARPNEEQFEWEEPRVIKSGMGVSTHGYNARLDILRLLGNGVVPQTATLAWNNLTSKIINKS